MGYLKNERAERVEVVLLQYVYTTEVALHIVDSRSSISTYVVHLRIYILQVGTSTSTY